METKTTDTQLEYELQDLYISSKHWISDISFVGYEIRFFNNVIGKYFKPDNPESQGAQMHHCKMMLVQLQEEIITLKIKVTAYLNFLGPYIGDPEKKIDLNLIEKHSVLENEVKALFESLRLLKVDLFAFTENVIDEERNCFI